MFSNLPSKIPWGSQSNSKPHDGGEGQEESLTTILKTAEDRTNLLLLIADCTDSMRKTMSDTFDPEKSGRAPAQVLETDGDGKPLSAAEKAQAKADADDAARKEHEQRVKEISSEKIQGLKKAALDYFDDWRDRVLERVGEAINQKDEAEEKKPPEHTGAPDLGSATEQERVSSDDEDDEAIRALHALYPPRETPLTALDRPKRMLIVHSLLLLILSLERYPGESRVLLLLVTSTLRLPISILTDDESKVAQGLLEAAKNQMSADDETKKRADENSTSRKWKVGLGAVAGAALIGVTGGLAAPLLAAGIGTVMGGLGLGTTVAATYLGAMAGSAPLVGVLFGAYGGRMTSKIVDQYAKEVQDFAFVPVRKPSMLHGAQHEKETRRLRVAIGISGWLTKQEDVFKPWSVIGPGIEAFALRWELEALMSLGNSLSTLVKSAAWSFAKSEIISRTIFGALTAGLWPLGLVKVARVVDNPFSVAKSRSEKAGAVLADALINKVQGERPVTLMGYSLGARVIYSCLLALADRGAFGLVESVVLAGAPTPSDSIAWRKMRSVVSGRLVNCYSTNDYLLGFLYRSSSLQYGIAGLQPVYDVVGIENVDLSEMVNGHTQYCHLVGSILKKVGIEDVDMAEVEKEIKELKREEDKEREEQEQKKANAEGRKRGEVGDDEAQEMEKEVEEKNKKGMMGWMSSTMSAMGIGSKSKDTEQQAPAPEEDTSEAEKFKEANGEDPNPSHG